MITFLHELLHGSLSSRNTGKTLNVVYLPDLPKILKTSTKITFFYIS